MRVLLQRVMRASVEVDAEVIASIGRGLLVFVGLAKGDTDEDLAILAKKIVHLRIHEDEQGKFNHSLLEVGGSLLVVSQFTLCADTKRGRRPSFTKAMPPESAHEFFARFVACLRQYPVEVQTGQFQANMQVSLCNDGPVTLWLESSVGRGA